MNPTDKFDDENLDKDSYLTNDTSIFGEENSKSAINFLKKRIDLKRGQIAPINDYIKGGNLLGAILYLRTEFSDLKDSDVNEFLAFFNKTLEDFSVALSDVVEAESMTNYLINDLGSTPEDADLIIRLWQYPIFDLQSIPIDLMREYVRVFQHLTGKKHFPAILHREIMGKAFELEMYIRKYDKAMKALEEANSPTQGQSSNVRYTTPNTFTTNKRFRLIDES